MTWKAWKLLEEKNSLVSLWVGMNRFQLGICKGISDKIQKPQTMKEKMKNFYHIKRRISVPSKDILKKIEKKPQNGGK